MSSIIDDQFIFYRNHSFSFHQNINNTLNNQQVTLKRQKQEIVKNLVKFFSNTNYDYIIRTHTETPSTHLKLIIIIYNTGLKTINLMISLEFDILLNLLKTDMILVQNQKPYQIQSYDQRIMACKMFSKSTMQNGNKFRCSIYDGSFKVTRPVIFCIQKSFDDIFNSRNKENNFKTILQNTILQGLASFKQILKLICPGIVDDPLPTNKKIQTIFSKTIYRYILRSPIQPAFDISFGSGKYDTMQFLTKQEIFNTASMIQNIVTDFSQFQSHHLYLTPNVPLNSLKQLYNKQFFTSNDQQLNSLKQKAMQPFARISLNMEPKYVYNMIQFNQNIPINLKRINMGGFSQISKADAQFWYLLSSDSKKSNSNNQNQDPRRQRQQTPLSQFKLKKQNKKCLVFKTNNYKGTQSNRNRVTHELKILSKFKGASSLFLPQYFKVINPKSPFYNYLIMQFLPYPTLNEYTDMNKISMSFLTKVHLSSLIVQSLRFLKNYQIIHLDLKPSNIIISKRMVIKLIDFGQSYHKEVCQKQFKPAFSMPYGCPQVFDGVGKTQFNEKNDVYSWAIIFYQLLFKKLPYFFPRQQAGKIFKERLYMNFNYFVPEQEQKYGYWQIIPLLRNIIYRSLSKDIKNRPCTLWLTVLLKQCLNYLINIELNQSNQLNHVKIE